VAAGVRSALASPKQKKAPRAGLFQLWDIMQLCDVRRVREDASYPHDLANAEGVANIV